MKANPSQNRMIVSNPEELCPEQADAIARGLLAIAASDGVHGREAFFASSCLNRDRPVSDLAWLQDVMGSPSNPGELADALLEAPDRWLFIHLARSIVYADGVISGQEQASIEHFAEALGISREELTECDFDLLTRDAGGLLAAPMPERTREQVASIYRDYLQSRDGEVDAQTQTLSAREARMREFEANPVRWTGSVDAARFERNRRQRVDAHLDSLTLFLLTAAQTSHMIGHAAQLATKNRKAAPGCAASVHEVVEAEEHLAGRMLGQIAGCFGLEFDRVPASRGQRWIVRAVASLPASMSLPVAVAAQAAAVVGIQLLVEDAQKLLAPCPDVRDRVIELLGEILTDQLGQLAYHRSQLDARGLETARRLVPRLVDRMWGKLVAEQTLMAGVQELRYESVRPLCSQAPFWIEPAPGAALTR